MKNFRQSGSTIVVKAPKDLKSGEAFIIGNLALIATDSFLKGEDAVCQAEGVYELPKKNEAETDIFKIGDYVTFAEGIVLPLTKGTVKAGIVWNEVGQQDKMVYVKINV